MGSLRSSSRRPWWNQPKFWVLGALAVGAVVAAAGMGPRLLSDENQSADRPDFQTHEVIARNMHLTVTESGNLESSKNVEVKCQIRGGTTLLEVIPDGSQVTKGTVLARLDSSMVDDAIVQQKILFEQANSAYIQAKKEWDVAKIALTEYMKGTFEQEQQMALANVVIAEENLRNSMNTLEFSERLFRKGYINKLQLETTRFTVERSKMELKSAEIALQVLRNYTKDKMTKELRAAIDAAEARKLAEKAATDLEKGKLDRLLEQQKLCTVKAPQSGMVIHNNESSRSRSSSGPEIVEGAMVRQFQTMFQLPDLSSMQVRVLVHESRVHHVHPGMRAIVRVRDIDMPGTVISVATQPESTSRWYSSVKVFATIVKIDDLDVTDELRPGMSATVEILADEREEVVAVPLVAVVERGGVNYCFVKAGDHVERRPIKVGMSNESYIEVIGGLDVGESVVLDPVNALPDLVDPDGASKTPADVARRQFPKQRSSASGLSSHSKSNGQGHS